MATIYASKFGPKLQNTLDAIAERRVFNAGTLTGEIDPVITGYLEDYAAFKADRPTYAVYSYGTPIAWYGARGWIIPEVNYSATTSRHQGIVRRAL